MKYEQSLVRSFHRAFNHPAPVEIKILSPERVATRATWLYEEVGEFEDAETVQQQADAMIDLIYFALGTMVELGVEIDPLFKIVHDANMRKIGNSTDKKAVKTIYTAIDGKVQKPTGWIDPKDAMDREILRQIKLSGI
jgi:predicted HAD superfamily Cof-like phosphohydrolase